MTQSVNYVWRCRKCSAENVPGIEACAQCGYPAIAVGSKTNDESISQPIVSESVITRHPWAFFPEGFVAFCIVVAAPAWIISLLLDGRFRAALVLLASTVVGIAVCWRGHRQNSVFVVWLGMTVVLAGGYFSRWL